MAAATPSAEHQSTEVFPWLKTLPVAPEYHPTLAEFEDPISYIFKIEKEASAYGICKIVPPLPAAPKKTAIANANRSLAARNPNDSSPTFTTRQQQIGFCPRKHRPVSKPVWQSGELYTLPEFETKAKNFERSYIKKSSKKGLTGPEVETLYWKANGDKPFSVEYANDMPGSAFAPVVSGGRGKKKERTETVTVGETAWNMRGVSRAKGSLLRFMKEEIPGVTSPMVYVAMMFSWFAWHAEDHDLHSLNYLHTGAGKTWYGVPRDAAVAFEEVVRVHGYGGEINPLVTFHILGEKTTVMSPEVLISAGIPCCRLVQNAGEFVVTFPRAYHSGFSHGYNLGEAANIATPGWLMVAKEAAIRRASISRPPMVSHIQLLYDLALSLCSRIAKSVGSEPRSSRLKDKKKGEGETLIKELFVEDVMKNNDLLHILGEGSSVVLLPQNYLEEIKASESSASRNIILDRKLGVNQLESIYPVKGKLSSLANGNRLSVLSGSDSACTLAPQTHKVDPGTERTAQGDRLSDKGLFSCVTCGILNFACVAIVQPREAAAHYLMSADCSIFNDHCVNPPVHSDGCTVSTVGVNPSVMNSRSAGRMGKSVRNGLFDVPVQAVDDNQTVRQGTEIIIDAEAKETASALGLLALNYGNSSDSEEDDIEADIPVYSSHTKSKDFAPVVGLQSESSSDDAALQVVDSYEDDGHLISNFRGRYQKFECSDEFESCNRASKESNSLGSGFRQQMKSSAADSNIFPLTRKAVRSSSNIVDRYENSTLSLAPRSDGDSSRLHVFCLQHAVEVEQRLRPIGGAHILLLCHPDYPELENEAKSVAEELGIDYFWNDVGFREAAKDDEETIQLALESADSVHGNGDWAVKLGINLYYSAKLSRSPLYSKQMPYNSIIYKAFGRSSTVSSPTKRKVHGKGPGKQKKIVVAGKWCGKVWMSNQVHSLLAERDTEEEEERGSHSWSKPNVVRHERERLLEIANPAEPNSLLNAEEEEEDEEEKGFRGWLKPDIVRHERERSSEIAHSSKTNSGIRKSGRKRKSTIKAEENFKAKRLKMEDSIDDLDDSLESCQKQKRSLRTKKMEPKTPVLLKSRIRHTRQSDSDIEEEEEEEDEEEGGPSTRLRKRAQKPSKKLVEKRIESKPMLKKPTGSKKERKSPAAAHNTVKMREEGGEYQCDVEGCSMAFSSKQELVMHKRNICPVKECGKKFFSHKYLVQHRRVHMDDRPLKCPWKGCKMSFKWAWARTEHIRVHTGARPYVCQEAGCGQTFRFVSDFSRHKRKTGHVGKKGRR